MKLIICFFMTQYIAKGLLFLPGDKCYSVNKVTLTEVRNDIDNLISISFILLLRQYLCSISCVNILSVLSSVNLHSNELTSSSFAGHSASCWLQPEYVADFLPIISIVAWVLILLRSYQPKDNYLFHSIKPWRSIPIAFPLLISLVQRVTLTWRSGFGYFFCLVSKTLWFGSTE